MALVSLFIIWPALRTATLWKDESEITQKRRDLCKCMLMLLKQRPHTELCLHAGWSGVAQTRQCYVSLLKNSYDSCAVWNISLSTSATNDLKEKMSRSLIKAVVTPLFLPMNWLKCFSWLMDVSCFISINHAGVDAIFIARSSFRGPLNHKFGADLMEDEPSLCVSWCSCQYISE